MRLILGVKDPYLLVEVKSSFDPDHFEFYVINGGWAGKYFFGDIIVYGNDYDEVVAREVKILCDNQSRLKGHYGDVFNRLRHKEFATSNFILAQEHYVPDPDDDVPF